MVLVLTNSVLYRTNSIAEFPKVWLAFPPSQSARQPHPRNRRKSRLTFAIHSDSFRVWGRHSRRNSANEGLCAAVDPHKTGALARVLRATAQYSICGWGFFAPSTTTSRSQAHLSVKAPEGKCGKAESKMSREVVSL